MEYFVLGNQLYKELITKSCVLDRYVNMCILERLGEMRFAEVRNTWREWRKCVVIRCWWNTLEITTTVTCQNRPVTSTKWMWPTVIAQPLTGWWQKQSKSTRVRGWPWTGDTASGSTACWSWELRSASATPSHRHMWTGAWSSIHVMERTEVRIKFLFIFLQVLKTQFISLLFVIKETKMRISNTCVEQINSLLWNTTL